MKNLPPSEQDIEAALQQLNRDEMSVLIKQMVQLYPDLARLIVTTQPSTPKKQKPSKFVGVLKRLQKTEVSINHNIVPSKKVRKTGQPMNRTGSTFNSQRAEPSALLNMNDNAEVQVPATPAPKKRH